MEFNLSKETQAILQQFLSQQQADAREEDREEDRGKESKESDEEEIEIHSETIGQYHLKVRIPEEEWNQEKKTLFATMIWHGARNLSHYLIQNYSEYRKNSLDSFSVLEFGAGVGIPSLICSCLGSSLVCISDYPTDYILEILRQNIDLNSHYYPHSRVEVVGYKWGTDPNEILNKNSGNCYDLILASECLWRHEQVRIIFSSALSLLLMISFYSMKSSYILLILV